MKKKISVALCIFAAVLVIAAVVFLIVHFSSDDNSDSSALDSASSLSSVTDSSEAESSEIESSSDDSESDASKLSPVSYYGELKADGNRIVGSKTGNPVQVTGMSFFWCNWSQHFYTAEYVDKMVNDFNCEVVRASYGIDDEGIPYDPACVEQIETVVRQAIEDEIYVIIDWHAHTAHLSPDEAISFFGDMAEKYGSYDNVIFEIYNEPTSVSWSKVKEYAELVIPEIRKYSDNLVIVGSPSWSQAVNKAADNPVDGENLAYTLHFYAGTHKKWLRDTADGALKAGIPLFVTEWGPVSADGNGAIDYSSTLEWLNWMNENGISYCAWAVNDKEETSSAYREDGTLTETGNFFKRIISDKNALSEWKTGKAYEFSKIDYDPAEFKVG